MSRLVTAALLTLLTALPAAAQKRPVTVDDVLGMKGIGTPMVSPDGTRVIYTVRQWESEKDRMESRTRIWMVPVAGGAARQITFGERGDSQPQWSPDGRYISFVSARGAATGDDPPRGQIYLMRADGGEAWKLTDSKESIASYSWSPDSRPHRLCRDRRAIERRRSRMHASAMTSACSRTTSAISTSGSSASTARARPRA